MAGRKLAVTTVVPAHGQDDVPDGYLVLGPDDTVPDWAADMIGDHCWADGEDKAEKPHRGRTAKTEDK